MLFDGKPVQEGVEISKVILKIVEYAITLFDVHVAFKKYFPSVVMLVVKLLWTEFDKTWTRGGLIVSKYALDVIESGGEAASVQVQVIVWFLLYVKSEVLAKLPKVIRVSATTNVDNAETVNVFTILSLE